MRILPLTLIGCSLVGVGCGLFGDRTSSVFFDEDACTAACFADEDQILLTDNHMWDAGVMLFVENDYALRCRAKCAARAASRDQDPVVWGDPDHDEWLSIVSAKYSQLESRYFATRQECACTDSSSAKACQPLKGSSDSNANSLAARYREERVREFVPNICRTITCDKYDLPSQNCGDGFVKAPCTADAYELGLCDTPPSGYDASKPFYQFW